VRERGRGPEGRTRNWKTRRTRRMRRSKWRKVFPFLFSLGRGANRLSLFPISLFLSLFYV